MIDTFRRFRAWLPRDSPPLALLGACLLAFGVFLPWWGFYQDDWHFIYYANQGLGRLWELSAYDNRPFASWPYIAGFTIAGFHPQAWQVIGLSLHWLTALAFWYFLRALWPDKARLAVGPALLFAIYPLYTLQPMAVTYITHWVCYFLYFISLWLMVLAVRDIRRLWPLFVLSLLLDALQLFTIEYFNGIEILRPIVLWMALATSKRGIKERAIKTTAAWLPYLSALLGFVYWRSFIFQSPAQDTNAPTVFLELIRSPLQTLLYLVGAMLKDSLLILFGAWSKTLAPGLIDFSPAGLAILLLSALTFVGFLAYLRRTQPEEDRQPGSLSQMALLGTLGLILGPIPAWVTHQPLYDTNPLWNSRLGMAAMFGAALLVTWLVETLVRTRRQRTILYALLIGLATGSLLREGNLYRNAWSREKDFLNQLAWRAPGLKAGTAFVSEGELLSLMGDYPTAFAINMTYLQPAGANEALVWYFPSYGNDTTAEKIADGSSLHERKFSTRFNGNGKDILVIQYDPSVSPCLHILTPQDADSRLYTDFLRSLAPYSDPARISPTPALNESFFAQALQINPGWCTSYQQAEMGVQQEGWSKVMDIWEAAQATGMMPTTGSEVLPFLRASLAMDHKSEAEEFTRLAASLTNSQAMRSTLCSIWQEREIPLAPALSEELRCEN